MNRPEDHPVNRDENTAPHESTAPHGGGLARGQDEGSEVPSGTSQGQESTSAEEQHAGNRTMNDHQDDDHQDDDHRGDELRDGDRRDDDRREGELRDGERSDDASRDDGPQEDRRDTGHPLDELAARRDHGLPYLYEDRPGADEEALRRLLHGAVQDLEPRDGTLQHLRRAVPARAARKRQALVGALATAVLLGTAVPAVIHVSRSPGASDDRPSLAGHREDTQGGSSEGRGPDEGSHDTEPDGSGASRGSEGKDDGKGEDGTDKGDQPSRDPQPDNTMSVSSPSCSSAELGNATASVTGPDGAGRVYGTFRVSNVSASNCTVGGPGGLLTSAQGTAEPGKINVVDHTSGDGSGLPDPSQEAGQLVLQPGMSYEVKFAWVPTESCGDPGGPSTDPTPTDSPGNTDQTGMSAQLADDGGGSVAVSHVAEPGAPSASTTIPNACAGTLYKTGVLAGS
ncbi:hypothetical protein ABZ929_04940 [Streptomyces physcomitrii]|uniref:hypothetical protein n=1 Tax=Streptomyces physcomitrii TaxID=2724184 RepID=UPI003408033D